MRSKLHALATGGFLSIMVVSFLASAGSLAYAYPMQSLVVACTMLAACAVGLLLRIWERSRDATLWQPGRCYSRRR